MCSASRSRWSNVKRPVQDQALEHSLALHFYARRPTNENWAPTFNDGTVRTYLGGKPGQYVIAVWGGDDHGYEQWVSTLEQRDALYRRLPIVIDTAELERQGYHPA